MADGFGTAVSGREFGARLLQAGAGERPQVLIPWHPKEAATVAEAARIAGKCSRTVRRWASVRHIGRRVVGGEWMISRPALLMLLEDNGEALAAYLSGDRSTEMVASYFRRIGL